MHGISLIAAAAFVMTTALAQAGDAFPKFKEEPINAKGSYQLIPDPTGSAPTAKVDSFTIMPGPCNAKSKYHDNINSDCTFNSVRSQLYQPKPDQTQPKEAWYRWSMYLPPDFPIYPRQSSGLYSFAYWHNQDCPHLAIVNDPGSSTKLRLQTNIVPKDGSYDCYPSAKLEFADLKDLVGKWHRFEAHVKWSTGDDGLAEIFLDGKQAVVLNGPTLSKEHPKPNYFKYGIYLCCTPGTEFIKPATVLFTDVARAKTQEQIEAVAKP